MFDITVIAEFRKLIRISLTWILFNPRVVSPGWLVMFLSQCLCSSGSASLTQSHTDRGTCSMCWSQLHTAPSYHWPHTGDNRHGEHSRWTAQTNKWHSTKFRFLSGTVLSLLTENSDMEDKLVETARFIFSTQTSDSTSVTVNYLIPILLFASNEVVYKVKPSFNNIVFSSSFIFCVSPGIVQPGWCTGYDLRSGLVWLQRSLSRIWCAYPVIWSSCTCSFIQCTCSFI